MNGCLQVCDDEGEALEGEVGFGVDGGVQMGCVEQRRGAAGEEDERFPGCAV